MKRISYEDKIAIPASVLFDPVTRRAAAYNASHRTITEDASPELVAYALAKGYRDVAFDPALHKMSEVWRPLPAWATSEVQGRMRLILTRSGTETVEELLAIPAR